MSEPIRLLIADDHAILREGLKQLLALNPQALVVGETTNGMETLERLRRGGVDLLLLDMAMPGISGEELIASVRTLYPGLPILILTMHIEPQDAQRALAAGATGYLTKDRDPEVLFEAIARVAAGNAFLDPAVAEQIAFSASGFGKIADHRCLTARELEVLKLFSGGMSVNEIAAHLSISNKTVSTHKARLMEKMGFDSNAALFRYAMNRKLIG